MEQPAKKQKFDSKAKRHFAKQAHFKKSNAFLDVGSKGYLITYISKEKECIREVYRLLNDFHQRSNVVVVSPKPADSDDDDITVQLNNAIDKNKEEIKEKAANFRAVEIGTPGSTFIQAFIDNHYELGLKIIKELAETKVKRTRFTNRIIPIEVVCKANVIDISNTAGKLFDKYFLKEPSTFAIIFNRKYNKEINRDEVIRELAKIVHEMNVANKVNLKEPEKTIIVDVLKGFCFLTVLTDYNKYKKFNLHALAQKDEEEKSQESSQNSSKNGDDGNENLEEISSSKTEEIASTNDDKEEAATKE